MITQIVTIVKNSITPCKYLCIILVLAFSLSFSCTKKNSMVPDYSILVNLPKDTGGIQTPVYYNSKVNSFGYYIYTPSGYKDNQAEYPLLIFLHGSGEKGNSMLDNTVLKKVLSNGPPKLIELKKWMPVYPMIVVSPQCHDSWWDGKKLHKFIGEILSHYRINKSRVYLTGLSMGGFGTFNYIETCYDSSYIAAAVPICGGGNPYMAPFYRKTPLWAFHGDADNTVNVSNSINMVKAINDENPLIPAKLTIFSGVGHDSWTITYDGSGMGKERKDYDPFDVSIYNWMFQYTK